MKADKLHKDDDLLLQIAQGNQLAFAQLVAKYAPAIHTHLVMYMKDVMKAEEATQDIMMAVWRNKERLPAMENFPGYVYTITRNRVKKLLKEKATVLTELPEDPLVQWLGSSEWGIEHKQLIEMLRNGVEQLPPRRKEIFQLSRYEQLSHDEIAQRLNISKNTIKQHIKEALVFLRNYIWQTNGEILALIALTIYRL